MPGPHPMDGHGREVLALPTVLRPGALLGRSPEGAPSPRGLSLRSEWRKMTSAIALWIGAMVVWGIHAAFTSSTIVADCMADAKVRAGDVSQEWCVYQASIGIELGVVMIGIVGLVGLVVLGATWFTTRPLWRQGYGARLRRLRPKTGLEPRRVCP
jgi:hypothetical protein